LLPELRALPHLAAQERFDRILATAFRRFGPRLVDLSYANPYDGPPPEVVDALRHAVDEQRELGFQYTPYGGIVAARRRIAQQLAGRFDVQLAWRDVVLAPGAMAALNVAFRALFDEQSELLVLAPCWLDYPLYLTNLGIPFRLVPLGPSKRVDLAAIESALTPRTGGVLFCHPGCPTGVVWSPGELADLARLLAAAERRHASALWVLSDEVHRDLVWSETAFHSALEFHPRTLSFYSFGKALALQGQRIGYLALSPRAPEREALRERLERCLRLMGFCTPTSLMQRALFHLLDHRPPLPALARRQRAVRDGLHAAGYEVCDAEATFFVYARAPLDDDFAFVERLAEEGVLALPSSMFHEPGFFRLSLTAREALLPAALDAFARLGRGPRCSKP
jgi:aspartate aminotransferase